jgi:hypothetical protein
MRTIGNATRVGGKTAILLGGTALLLAAVIALASAFAPAPSPANAATLLPGYARLPAKALKTLSLYAQLHAFMARMQPLGANVRLTFPLFPTTNPWNTDISGYPVHPLSSEFIANIGADGHLHPDFGTVWDGAPNGIPYVVVPGNQPLVPVTFDYADESDAGPYPIPPDAPIEGGSGSSGDRHVLIVDAAHRKLYELYDAHKVGTGWQAGSGAIFDLTSNALRPDSWTSADAAGLPILPGLVRYDEVAAGEINHALRFTVSRTQKGYIHPATHCASSNTDPSLPPMGLRLRLKASYPIDSFPASVQVILRALKKYGMIVADNGSSWYISGAPDPRWSDDELHALSQVPGSAFEAVYTGATITQ